MRQLRPAALFLACAALASQALAAKGPKASDLLLPDGFPPLTERDKTLTSVASAPGAPAVVLFEGMQYQWEENFVRTRFCRRVKILTDAGTADHGDYARTFLGEWRTNSVRARTVLPDGTEVDAASNVHVEASKDPDITKIKVTFPRVQAGAILDVAIDANANNASIPEWIPQEAIPVAESRLLLVPPVGMRYRTALARMKPEEVEAVDMRYGASETLFAWTFRDVPPLPDLPNMPPRGDLSKKLVLINESYRYGSISVPLASDWPTYCKDMAKNWDDWLKKKSGQCAQLGQQVAGAATTPRDKAEAVRKALRQRMSASYVSDWPSAETPDEALLQGKGNSADVAGVAVAMLRGAGVTAQLAAYRLRSSGTLPSEFPTPSMLDDVLVVLPGAGEGGADAYVEMVSELPAGQLSPDAVGVFVVPFRKDSKGPVLIPDPPADQNALSRKIALTLALDGTVTGDATFTANGTTAHDWRADLRDLSADDRKKYLENYVREAMPAAVLTSFSVESLDDESKDLVVKMAWEASGAVQKAGSRLLLNPFLFGRISADDWGADKREQDIWLGRPWMRTDEVTLTMPQGIKSVQLPAGQSLEAPNVGGYTSTYGGKDMVLTATRRLRFDQVLFPASAWDPLRSWFQDMAKGDDQSIVFTLADQEP